MPDSAPLPAAKPSSNIGELQVTTGAFPSSRKVFATSKRYGDLRVAIVLERLWRRGVMPVTIDDHESPN